MYPAIAGRAEADLTGECQIAGAHRSSGRSLGSRAGNTWQPHDAASPPPGHRRLWFMTKALHRE
jgi:hypothetical protein